ncbi:hypothetical protein [Acrocarpospora pleiomorpha]|nr:hypothetical protein [Acrocarpospora pleiomorpha]
MDVRGLRVTYPSEGIAPLELDRPHRRNALDRAQIRAVRSPEFGRRWAEWSRAVRGR